MIWPDYTDTVKVKNIGPVPIVLQNPAVDEEKAVLGCGEELRVQAGWDLHGLEGSSAGFVEISFGQQVVM